MDEEEVKEFMNHSSTRKRIGRMSKKYNIPFNILKKIFESAYRDELDFKTYLKIRGKNYESR